MKQPSFGIIAPNYGRPNILRLWCAQIKRLRQELNICIPACIISEEEDKSICDEYFISHVTHENDPVTEKFNKGCEWIRNIGLDYMLILGSDDICSTGTIRRVMVEMKRCFDVIGIDGVYFYSIDGQYRGQLVHLQGKRMLGVCKAISSSILEKVNWRPWHKERSWGMDAIASQNIAPHVKSKCIISNTIVVDCKSKVNINHSGLWFRKIKIKSDPNIFYNILSDEEKQILKTR